MAMNRADYIKQGKEAASRGDEAGTNTEANTWQKRAWMEGYLSAGEELTLPKEAFVVPTAPIMPSQGKTTFGRPSPDYVALEMHASDMQRRVDIATGATTGRTPSLAAALTPIPVALAKLNKTMREAVNVMNEMGRY